MSEPHAKMAPLQILIGTWMTTITTLDADGEDLDVSQATDVYQWAPGARFVLHDVDAEMGGQHIQSFEVVAANPDGPGYACRSYDADGSFSDFTADLDGLRWQIHGAQQRFDGTFSSDGKTLSGRWEQNEGGRWKPLMDVILRKSA